MSELDKIKDFLLKNYPSMCEAFAETSLSEIVIKVITAQDTQLGDLSHAYHELLEENK